MAVVAVAEAVAAGVAPASRIQTMTRNVENLEDGGLQATARGFESPSVR